MTAQTHIAADPDFARRVHESFSRQGLMQTLGAELIRVEPGEIEIQMPIGPAISQQHGFAHAGAVAAIADSACGYAAFSLMPSDSGVLAVEFKINLMAPAAGDTLLARARVVRAGRTLSICQAEVAATSGSEERPVAIMTATIMNVRNRPGVQG
jgi:uncharacterized protein (TIGR00369 family)